MSKSIECAHRKYEKVSVHRKQSYRILEYTVFCSGQGKYENFYTFFIKKFFTFLTLYIRQHKDHRA